MEMEKVIDPDEENDLAFLEFVRVGFERLISLL